MKKVFLLAILLTILPLVLAVSTPILIKAPAGNNVTINVIQTQNDILLKTYQIITNSNNEATMSHESEFSGSIYLTIIARKDGRITSYNESNPLYRSNNFYSGNAITIDYIRAPPIVPTPIPNETASNATQAAKNNSALVPKTDTATQAQDTITTGSSVLSTIPLKKIGIYVAYIIVGIIVLGILILFVMRTVIPSFNNPIKKAEFSGYSTTSIKDKAVEKDLTAAEQKLKEAQAEIDRIRNRRNEVKQAEAKFLEAKRELERVKRESE